MNYIVYKTTNLINGKIYVGVHRTNPDIFDGYIGCGVSKKDQKNKINKGFPSAVKKYGYENFKRETLYIFEDTKEGKEKAYKKEQEIVNIDFIKDPNTYNISLGGNYPNYPHEREIYQYTLEGVFIRSWNSIKEAEDLLCLTSIQACCSGKSKYCGNFQWRYASDNLKELSPVTKKEKTVYQFDLSGNYLKCWKSISEAATQFENFVSAKTVISNVCNKRANSAFGYYWSFKNKFNYVPYKGQAVAKYTLDGVFIQSYDSVREAAEAHNIKNPTNINSCIKGFHKTCAGFRWRYFYGNTNNIKPL